MLSIFCGTWKILELRTIFLCDCAMTFPTHVVTINKIWWLCLVPSSTTRFASDVGYRIAKKVIGLYKQIIFMNNDIKFLNLEWRTPYPSQILKTVLPVLDCMPQLFLAMTKQLYEWYFLSVCLSQLFIRLPLDRTYYGMALSVRPSIWLLARKNIEGISGLFSNLVCRCA